jgi:oxygen-independent coproporphyrinogen-3 oxidase
MAGIYIHIPFCKQPCSYCNFYFQTTQYFKKSFITALSHEIILQKNYLNGAPIQTIYFGGGTPSVLTNSEIDTILNQISKHHQIAPSPEITLEANPDDITPNKIKEFKESDINRLSIGIQSFHQKDLQLMNRAHNANEAENCIKISQDAQIENISIDLIYGTPGLTQKKWEENLQKAEQFKVKHLSCYALTVEENTPLFHQIRKKKVKNPSDTLASLHFNQLLQFTQNHNWQHYEISNFCKEGYISQHNSAYWQGKNYLGLGPSAHSFNNHSRQWNIANTKKYIETINKNIVPYTIENLTQKQKWNEKIMIGLRTSWGINLIELQELFPDFTEQFYKTLKTKNQNNFIQTPQNLKLSKKAIFFADQIASDFFID